MPPPAIRRLALLALASALVPGLARATPQIPDEIVIGGRSYPLLAEPLESLPEGSPARDALREALRNAEPDPASRVICSVSWRGYKAHWQIRRDRLELVRLLGNPCVAGSREAELAAAFPGAASPVPARWFSGRLVMPLVPPATAEQLARVRSHAIFDRYLILTVEQGRVVARGEANERPR